MNIREAVYGLIGRVKTLLLNQHNWTHPLSPKPDREYRFGVSRMDGSPSLMSSQTLPHNTYDERMVKETLAYDMHTAERKVPGISFEDGENVEGYLKRLNRMEREI